MMYFIYEGIRFDVIKFYRARDSYIGNYNAIPTTISIKTSIKNLNLVEKMLLNFNLRNVELIPQGLLEMCHMNSYFIENGYIYFDIIGNKFDVSHINIKEQRKIKLKEIKLDSR